MNSWHSITLNPQAIESIYGNVPTLDSVEIVRLSLVRDGPNASIQFLLNVLPERVPLKWGKPRQVSITLDLMGVRSLHLDGWATHPLGSLILEKLPDSSLRFEFRSPNKIEAVMCCDFVRIASITGI
jgi:hypothetical protein